MIRVLLVDDQDLVRAGLRGVLREQFGFEIAGECADGTEVLAAAAACDPDIVLMDVRMPLLDGVAATRRLRAERPSLPVLALTTFDDDAALAGMLRAGAAGFVLKEIPAEELHRAVRIVAQGGAWLDPAVTSRVLAVYRTAPAGPPVPPQALDLLTNREREVLGLIGQGHTNAEIARELFVGEGTVKTHINHVFTKLGLRDRAAAIIFAHDHKLTGPRGGGGR
jgi:DNA-binding NarL/FixJ family response regulator